MTEKTKKESQLENIALKLPKWLGTTASLIVHSLFFMVTLSLAFFGFQMDQILLILTTAVSLEAIYLSLFIQMSVNKAADAIEDVEEDIDEIQEDVQEMGVDIDEIQEDVEEMGEDVEEIHTAHQDDDEENETNVKTLDGIENKMSQIVNEIEDLKRDLRKMQK